MKLTEKQRELDAQIAASPKASAFVGWYTHAVVAQRDRPTRTEESDELVLCPDCVSSYCHAYSDDELPDRLEPLTPMQANMRALANERGKALPHGGACHACDEFVFTDHAGEIIRKRAEARP